MLVTLERQLPVSFKGCSSSPLNWPRQALSCAAAPQAQISPAALASGLVLGWVHQPAASTDALAAAVCLAGSPISGPGLCRRFTAAAAAFLLGLLRAALTKVLAAPPSACALLDRFPAVYLLDSTQVPLPDESSADWPACGGNAAVAGLKCMCLWELRSGELKLELAPARQADAAFAAAAGGPAAGVAATGRPRLL